jgi:hypothetical protein
MEMVQYLGPEILEVFCRVGESLLEPIPPEIDMPDDLSFIWLKRTFALGIKGGCQSCRIGTAFADRRPEKLENVVVPETSKPIATTAAVFQLTERRQRQATAGNHCDELYYVFFPKHLWIKSIECNDK